MPSGPAHHLDDFARKSKLTVPGDEGNFILEKRLWWLMTFSSVAKRMEGAQKLKSAD